VRLGLMYVNGLRQDVGRAIAGMEPVAGSGVRDDARVSGLAARGPDPGDTREHEAWSTDRCPKCGCDDQSMLEATLPDRYFCNICAFEWGKETGLGTRDSGLGTPGAETKNPEPGTSNRNPEPGTRNPEPTRYSSLDHLIARTHVRRDELATLADIGALNAFGFDRRSALWQVERAVRPPGELFAGTEERLPPEGGSHGGIPSLERVPNPESRMPTAESPLRPMTPPERLMADYAGTSLTIGPHPLALRRAELALRGVLRASDLPRGRHGRRVRIAGAVITRQRPGTAKGFVFLTIEDETGIANVIVRPDLFTEQRTAIVGEPYLLIEGTLQIQEGVTSIKAERVIGLSGGGPEPQSHDFR
jgi:error-prone DNA polymerase